MRVDVAIVGGGPTGSFVGKGLAEHGLDVVIVEEHREIGNPVCCTGIVGVEGLKELDVKPEKWVLGKLRKVAVYTPSNERIELTRGKVEAFVINRAEFDRSLAQDAANAGATFLLNERCIDLNIDGELVVKLKGEQKIKLIADVVVGADGPTSIVSRKAGLGGVNKNINCIQVETIAEASDDTAEVYFGKSFAPGFFGWLVKAGDVCRVGLGTAEGNSRSMLENFLYHHPVVSRKVKETTLNMCAGLSPLPLSCKLNSDRVLLVGDAAGQVKPLTGGGIYVGLSCAKLAVKAIVNAFKGGDVKKIKNYELAVMTKFGKDFELGIRARILLEHMQDKDLNLILGLLKRDEIREIVLKNFDFNRHGSLVRALMLKSPELLRSLGIKRLIKYAHFFMNKK